MSKSIPFWAFVATAILFTSSVIAQERDRFGLFTNCEPVDVAVESLGTEANDLGLRQERLETLVEAALLGARIPTTDLPTRHYLYLFVTVTGVSYARHLEFKKVVFDPMSAESGVATTWESSGGGTHGKEAEFIISAIRGALDQFVVEYLRANLAECAFESPFQDPIQ